MNSQSHKKFTILYITPQPFLAQRGSPLRVRATLRALIELGHAVNLLAFPFGDDCQMPGLTVHRCRKLPWVREVLIGPSWTKFLMDLLLFWEAWRCCRKVQPTVLHGIEEGGIIAAVLGLLLRTPFVFDQHSLMSRQIRDRRFCGAGLLAGVVARLESFCIRRAAAVITVADEITAHARTLAPRVPSDTLPDLPIDVEQVTADEIRELRERLGLLSQKVIVYTGNFDPYQGIDLLLKGFSQYLKSRPAGDSTPAATLLIVGGGPGEEDRKREQEQTAERLGLDTAVIFVGSRPVDEMGAFMQLADVLISPRTAGNNTPLKVYSYMASGRPMVATNISSHTQVLDDSCAILCDPTPQDLADKLEVALSDSAAATARRAAQVLAAKQRVAERFSLEKFRGKLDALYAQIK